MVQVQLVQQPYRVVQEHLEQQEQQEPLDPEQHQQVLQEHLEQQEHLAQLVLVVLVVEVML